MKLPDRALRLGLATTLTLAGLKLVEMPGAELVILAVLGVVAVLLVGAGVRRVARRRPPLAPDPR